MIVPVADILPLTAPLGGPSVTELLLRRSRPLLNCKDRVDACLLHAACAAVVTLGRGEHDCGRGVAVAVCSGCPCRCADAVLTCDGRVKAEAEAATVERGARDAVLCVCVRA